MNAEIDIEAAAAIMVRLNRLEAALTILADRYNWAWSKGSWIWQPEEEQYASPIELATNALEGKS